MTVFYEEKIAIDDDGVKYKLSNDEIRLLKLLDKVNKLWPKAGKRFCLYNGIEVRILNQDDNTYFANQNIHDLSNIFGDGGDGGDRWDDCE